MNLRNLKNAFGLIANVFFAVQMISSSAFAADDIAFDKATTSLEIASRFKACSVRDMSSSAQTIHDLIDLKANIDFAGCDLVKIDKMPPKSYSIKDSNFLTLNYMVLVSAQCEDKLEFANYTATVETVLINHRDVSEILCKPVGVE